MSIAVQQVGLNATVLRVCGEVDLLTAPMLQAEVDKQLMLPRLIVVIDLSGTTFFGVSGVAVLLEIRDQVAHTATSLRLVQRSRVAAKPLELLHLSGLFLTYTHLADTLGA
jgi:anti-sigma B factor antagonist